MASKFNCNVILWIFDFYFQSGGFLISLLRLTTSYDSLHPQKYIYLFCQALQEILGGFELDTNQNFLLLQDFWTSKSWLWGKKILKKLTDSV